ncbi:MAG: response regulator transcription factor [Saprospiraceae bacterium]|nr:MAG: response regulator transcription factor [Saprospiraceae bacterium]
MKFPSYRVLVADDHQIFIEGLKVVLGQSKGFRCELVGAACTGNAIVKLACQQEADLLLLDMNLPDMDGLEVLSQIKAREIPLHIIILSMYDEPKIVKAAFKGGVDGYVLKSNNVEELYSAITAVMEGETYISSSLSFTNGGGRHSRLMTDGRLKITYDDRFLKKFNLTRREMEVMKMVGHAMSNKEIAGELYISDQTVSVHRKNIMRKLGVCSSASLIKMAFENNLL